MAVVDRYSEGTFRFKKYELKRYKLAISKLHILAFKFRAANPRNNFEEYPWLLNFQSIAISA